MLTCASNYEGSLYGMNLNLVLYLLAVINLIQQGRCGFEKPEITVPISEIGIPVVKKISELHSLKWPEIGSIRYTV